MSYSADVVRIGTRIEVVWLQRSAANMEHFTIDVNKNRYQVEPICDEDCTRFKISTECEYLFTLCVDEYGNWQVEEDVIPLTENLVEEIGRAIEFHDAQ
jgi:hypothetical protein